MVRTFNLRVLARVLSVVYGYSRVGLAPFRIALPRRLPTPSPKLGEVDTLFLVSVLVSVGLASWGRR